MSSRNIILLLSLTTSLAAVKFSGTRTVRNELRKNCKKYSGLSTKKAIESYYDDEEYFEILPKFRSIQSNVEHEIAMLARIVLQDRLYRSRTAHRNV